MIPPIDSLLKYGNPILISKKADPKSTKARPLKGSPQQPADSGSSAPHPISKSSAAATGLQCEEVLDIILPPREWTEGNHLWMQHVSSTPCTNVDVRNLEEHLDTKIQQRQARITGICPIRRELYSQCFDELIRQVTINCAERGLLLLRVRNEIQMTLAAYQALYESSVAFGMRKALQAEKDKRERERKIESLENEAENLKKHLNEQKAKCETIEMREAEKRMQEETKYTEEIHRLKTTNEQLKAEIEGIIAPKK